MPEQPNSIDVKHNISGMTTESYNNLIIIIIYNYCYDYDDYDDYDDDDDDKHYLYYYSRIYNYSCSLKPVHEIYMRRPILPHILKLVGDFRRFYLRDLRRFISILNKFKKDCINRRKE
jgi:hypothetical protein